MFDPKFTNGKLTTGKEESHSKRIKDTKEGKQNASKNFT